jgi:hypothetical protein
MKPELERLEDILPEIEDYLLQNIDTYYDPEMNRFYPSEENQLLVNLRTKQPFETQLAKVKKYLESRNDSSESTDLLNRLNATLQPC